MQYHSISYHSNFASQITEHFSAQPSPCFNLLPRFLIPRALLGQLVADGLAHLLGITQKHVSVALVEDRIVHTSVAHGHRALHKDSVLGLPHLENRGVIIVYTLMNVLANAQSEKLEVFV